MKKVFFLVVGTLSFYPPNTNALVVDATKMFKEMWKPMRFFEKAQLHTYRFFLAHVILTGNVSSRIYLAQGRLSGSTTSTPR